MIFFGVAGTFRPIITKEEVARGSGGHGQQAGPPARDRGGWRPREVEKEMTAMPSVKRNILLNESS